MPTIPPFTPKAQTPTPTPKPLTLEDTQRLPTLKRTEVEGMIVEETEGVDGSDTIIEKVKLFWAK